MPLDITIFKIIHLISAMLFVGSLFFITYVLDVVKRNSDKSEYKLFAPKVSKRARNLMYVNVSLVLASGVYLLFVMYDFSYLSLAMLLKLFLAVVIGTVFYTSDWIIKKTNHIKWFHHFFHHAVIAMMMLVVILSQVM